MVAHSGNEVAGEHALRAGERDRLGFEEIAARIANSIVDRASKDGLVIGLDGRWGSGKSSLLHLIERSIEQFPQEKRSTVINFRPWLVGNRDALLTSLLAELADNVANVNLARGNASQANALKAKKAAEAVRRFGNALAKTGDLLEAVGDFVPAAGIVGKLFKGGKSLAEKDQGPTDLAALKEEVVKDLADLGHRFIVTVDDVDRLEPAEVIEVLRLVRSVADFPNIVYLLCYDSERLAESIETGAKVKDGGAFLEKIVQLTVMIPKPEPFELRQWFAEDIEAIIGSVSDEVRDRLKTIIDQEGARQFQTPRSVVRTIDSIRFFWPAVRDEKIDAADLVWLQMIKDGSPRLYRWVESYVASVAATSFGTTAVSDSAQAESLQELQDAAGKSPLADLMYRHTFSELLPGIEASFDDDGAPVSIYQKISPSERQAAIDGRRLASPDHYRLFFSLIGPTHAITQAGFDRFWEAAETGPGETANILLSLHGQMALGALRKIDVLFERLRAMESDLWSPESAKNVLLGLGQMMDDAYRNDPSEGAFIVTTWDRAQRLLPALYAKLPKAERAAINEQLFANGVALSWLTSILRRETFAHGRFGSRKKAPQEWILSEEEFLRAYDIMLGRYRSMTVSDLLAIPRPLQMLFAWSQAGDAEGPRGLITEAIRTDTGLLEVSEIFTSTVDSSDRGRYAVLKTENVEPFADYNVIVSRLKHLAEHGPTEVRGRAQKLVSAVIDGEQL